MSTSYRQTGVLYREPGLNYRGDTQAIPPDSTVTGQYRFVIADLTGAELDEVPVLNPQWSFVLNDAGTASFEIKLRDPKATKALLTPGQRELHIYKGSALIWSGRIWAAQSQVEQETVRFSAEGHFATLKRRYIDETLKYENIDQFDIAWNLIAFTQAKTDGNIGITQGGAPLSTIKRDRTFAAWERTKIGEEIIAMSEVHNGFDFEVTPNKVWIPYFPSKGQERTVPYELGHNIGGLSVLDDASDMANEWSAIGAGDGKNTCIAVSIDVASRATYGLLQESESLTDIKRFTTLQDRADEALKMRKKPRVEPQLSVFFISENPYTNQVGDKVTIKADYGYIQLNSAFRIISLTFQLSLDGREAVTVAFDAEVDV